MEPKKLKRDLIIIVVSSFIVIVCWIGFNIYSKSVTSTIDESLTKQILPIDPNFDTATVNNLSGRDQVAPLYQGEGPTPTPTPLPTPTEAIQPTLEPVSETESQSTEVIPTDIPTPTEGAVSQ